MTDRTQSGGLFTFLVFIALILTLAAVLLSAYLRLESIGLGCEGWPGCFGQMPEARDHGLVPTTTAGAVHRFTASLLGLIVVAITLLALRGRRPAAVGPGVPLLIFALTVFLSVLGYSTPSPDIPAVTFGNLLGGMAMLALLWWTGQRSVESIDADDPATRALRPWALLGLLVVAVQIALGAVTSASFAGPACTALPGCSGDWVSVTNLMQGLDLFGRLGVDDQGRVITGSIQKTLHMTHRLGAVLTFLYLGWLALRALKSCKLLRNTAVAILVFLVVQALTGISAVLTELPLLLVTAHNAIAAMLLLAVVNLYHLVTPTRKTTPS
ncbi:MAG TPA: heme A synthase [Gammaproteobacteria bacterium]|nr:heme A synthase [Gammaproteobacteria bacterium]